MLFDEFNNISIKKYFGKVTYAVFEEVELIYMCFENMIKEYIVDLYWNNPNNYRHALRISKLLNKIRGN